MCTRRDALGRIAMLGVAPWWALPRPRVLDMVRLDDGEHWVCEWFNGVTLDQQGYEQACQALRDRHQWTKHGVVAIAPRLLQVLWEIETAHRNEGYTGALMVYSGYRSELTNQRTEGSVPDSMHVAGSACDFHVTNVPLVVTRRLTELAPGRGGVGYYPRSNGGWIHVDVSDRREWVG